MSRCVFCQQQEGEDARETRNDEVAEALLEGTGLSLLEAVRLVLEIKEALPLEVVMAQRSLMPLYRRIIKLGADAFSLEFRTICFREAVEKSLQSRAGRRTRTLAEIRQVCRRVLRSFPELSEMPLRQISSEYCRKIVSTAFHTPTTRRKARLLLHGIFAFSMRHGWCAANPMMAVDIPRVSEKTVEVLSLAQVRRLLAAARLPEHLPCAPAVGLMLWAGIRPTEVTRLRWEDIRMEDRVISIEASHAKTGGARHVTLQPILSRWLCETAPFRLPHACIVPCSWIRRWRALRLAAGFVDWHPDTLRHTFASYHLKQFRNLSTLQIDMGHGDLQLLRTRYLGMKGITSAGAAEFWGKRRPSARKRKKV